MKNYFSTHDIQNIQELINQALELKKSNTSLELGKGKTLGLLFF